MHMAGIAKGGVGNLPLLPRPSIGPLAGALDISAPPGDGNVRRRGRRRPHRPCHPRLHLVSTNGSCSREASAAASSNAFLSRSGIRGRGHPRSMFPMANDRARALGQSTAEPSSRRPDRRPQSDPTARRPTRKCDPYGLEGGSLSRSRCAEMMATLEDGWELLRREEPSATASVDDPSDDADGGPDDECARGGATTVEEAAPTFLRKRYFHRSLHEASQFLSRVSLLATNLNHYPYLSMERVLVDDLNNIHGKSSDEDGNGGGDLIERDDNNNCGSTVKKRKRKVKGWVFRSTVRCSTYRPHTAGSADSRPPSQADDEGELHRDKGLTYHDFHLAMSVDVEVNREDVKALLWSDPQE